MRICKEERWEILAITVDRFGESNRLMKLGRKIPRYYKYQGAEDLTGHYYMVDGHRNPTGHIGLLRSNSAKCEIVDPEFIFILQSPQSFSYAGPLRIVRTAMYQRSRWLFQCSSFFAREILHSRHYVALQDAPSLCSSIPRT